MFNNQAAYYTSAMIESLLGARGVIWAKILLQSKMYTSNKTLSGIGEMLDKKSQNALNLKRI